MSTCRRKSSLPLLLHIRLNERMAFQHSLWTILPRYEAVNGPASKHNQHKSFEDLGGSALRGGGARSTRVRPRGGARVDPLALAHDLRSAATVAGGETSPPPPTTTPSDPDSALSSPLCEPMVRTNRMPIDEWDRVAARS